MLEILATIYYTSAVNMSKYIIFCSAADATWKSVLLKMHLAKVKQSKPSFGGIDMVAKIMVK